MIDQTSVGITKYEYIIEVRRKNVRLKCHVCIKLYTPFTLVSLMSCLDIHLSNSVSEAFKWRRG